MLECLVSFIRLLYHLTFPFWFTVCFVYRNFTLVYINVIVLVLLVGYLVGMFTVHRFKILIILTLVNASSRISYICVCYVSEVVDTGISAFRTFTRFGKLIITCTCSLIRNQ